MTRSNGRGGAASDPSADRALLRALVRWFRAEARELPWRAPEGRRDPYRVLVSEVMLQQTQAARVRERFDAFMDRFPTVRALAEASEQDVLAEWSGLGYYARGRNLHRAARALVETHGGAFPESAESLESLPGIGRYTAGAMASLAFGRASPAVDANVQRVLMRLGARREARDDRRALAWAWSRAGELVRAGARTPGAGVVNEALIELGAVVCTPRSPRCGACPLRGQCLARQRGLESEIPGAKRRARTERLCCATVVVTDRAGRLLVHQRAARGLWASLWQAPTLEGPERVAPERLTQWLGLPGAAVLRHVTSFEHPTTHRRVGFEVWRSAPLGERSARAVERRLPGSRWVPREGAAELPLSSAQRRILLGGAEPVRERGERTGTPATLSA